MASEKPWLMPHSVPGTSDVFKDQFPETRRLLMELHGHRSYQFEYLKPGTKPTPFDFDKAKIDPEVGHRIHSVYDAVKADPPEASMRMVLCDGKWRLVTQSKQPVVKPKGAAVSFPGLAAPAEDDAEE